MNLSEEIEGLRRDLAHQHFVEEAAKRTLTTREHVADWLSAVVTEGLPHLRKCYPDNAERRSRLAMAAREWAQTLV